MGVVYAARDDRLERTIALKTLSTPAGDDTGRQRLWREARAAASVNHPNICQIYEVGEDDGRVFIVMELLDGEALSARLERGPLSAMQAVPITLGILAALAALHARGIVHRDLKPANVLINNEGLLKIVDFGVAAAHREGDTQLTKTGYTILRCLMKESPRIVSRATLEHAVWGDDRPDSDALRAHIHAVRQAPQEP